MGNRATEKVGKKTCRKMGCFEKGVFSEKKVRKTCCLCCSVAAMGVKEEGEGRTSDQGHGGAIRVPTPTPFEKARG